MISPRINPTVLAARMGHESSSITERRYIHLFDRQRSRIRGGRWPERQPRSLPAKVEEAAAG